MFGVQEDLRPPRDGHPVLKRTIAGSLPVWVCSAPGEQPVFTVAYFVAYTIVSAFVIMSLFVGVITIGMFTGYSENQERIAREEYEAGIDSLKAGMFDDPENEVRKLVDNVMGLEAVRRARADGTEESMLEGTYTPTASATYSPGGKPGASSGASSGAGVGGSAVAVSTDVSFAGGGRGKSSSSSGGGDPPSGEEVKCEKGASAVAAAGQLSPPQWRIEAAGYQSGQQANPQAAANSNEPAPVR